MPGKSRHRKGKYSTQTKSKRKDNPSRPGLSARQPSTEQADQPTSHPVVPAPPASITIPTTNPVRYLYITTELRTIGILAGIILIVLVLLAQVLS
ncbi:hypothetical protein ACFLU1_04570 [Chloroflexota bacterium]